MQKTAKKKGFFVSIMDFILKFVKMDLIERRNLAGYLFILPFLLGLLLVFLPSLWRTFVFSINDIIIRMDGTGFDLQWYGFGYYVEAFTVDVDFRKYLLETFRDMVINLPVIMIFSFFMAVMLNKKKLPGRTVFRVIFFMPVIIYTGVASAAGTTSGSGELEAVAAQVFADPMINAGGSGMKSGLASLTGVATSIEGVISSLSIGSWLMDFIMLSVSRLEWIIQSSGVQIIVFLSALQSIPTSIFEAASVEGLTGWEMFWKITFPMISPMILVNAVYTIVDTFTNTRYQIASYINTVSFSRTNYSLGSAMSFIYFLLVIILIGIIAAVCSRFMFYQE
jgi:ABC-type sugar transport system permease subunit